LQFFRLKPYKTAEFKVAVPKTEVLKLPQLSKKACIKTGKKYAGWS
jgi:hypothetical protein